MKVIIRLRKQSALAWMVDAVMAGLMVFGYSVISIAILVAIGASGWMVWTGRCIFCR